MKSNPLTYFVVPLKKYFHHYKMCLISWEFRITKIQKKKIILPLFILVQDRVTNSSLSSLEKCFYSIHTKMKNIFVLHNLLETKLWIVKFNHLTNKIQYSTLFMTKTFLGLFKIVVFTLNIFKNQVSNYFLLYDYRDSYS